MKNRISNIIIALAGVLSLSVACQKEDLLLPGINGSQDGYINLRFNVEVPDMQQVQTKAVDPDGGGVQQISVFCFDQNDLFITVTTAKVKADSESLSLTGTFEVSVPDHSVTLQLVGNQNLTYFKEENYRGMSEVDVMSALEASAGRMIYWARKTVEELSSANTSPVKLLRNQARISLNVETDFQQKGWVVVNSNAFGTVAPYSPEYGGFVAPSVDKPFVTLPDNRAKLGDYLDVRNVSDEYIFETENTAADPVDFIVKGSYPGGEDLYYRISLMNEKGDYVMIMRNCHYTVNITGDLYYGQPTFQQALEAPATNNVWVSVSDNISKVQDSRNSLEVEKTHVVIGEDEFKDPNTYYLHYTISNLDGSTPSQAQVSWMDGNNVALSNFTHSFNQSTGVGTILITLNQMGDLMKREGTLFVKYGRLTRKIKVITVKEQNFEPAWVTTNIYGQEAGENVTMMFTVPDDCPTELFPMDVLLSVNDMDIRNASGMVLPVIRSDDPRYGEDNGIGYKYVLTVTEPGMQRAYLKSILDHTEDGEQTVTLTIEAPHFRSLSKTATFQTAVDARILIHNLSSYVGAMPADEYIYYYLVPQKINAPVEFQAHLGQVVDRASMADLTLANPKGEVTYFRYIDANADFSTTDGDGYNVDEFLLYSQNLEHNHDYKGDFYFDFYTGLNPANWSATGGRVLGFFRNSTAATSDKGATLHLKTNKPKANEVVRIASNVYGAPSVTTGTAGELAEDTYVAPEGKSTGTGRYKSCVFELSTYHPFHFAATINGVGENIQGEKEETVDDVLLNYMPGQTVNIEFDVTSFKSTIRGNDNQILDDSHQVSVDPFGTAFDIYIDAPMLQIDETSDVYKSGKIEKHPTIEGRFIYHVDADRADERWGDLVATQDTKTSESQVGERKRIPFKTRSIVSAGDITISSDESKVVFYKKRFRVQNNSFRGVLQYRKNNQVVNIPANAFVPFEVEPTYNRIGTVTISDGGNYELRLRSEYRYDWNTDAVKFQYVEDGVTYEKPFQSLSALNSSSGPIILEPVTQ
jgi:hypothetical protein